MPSLKQTHAEILNSLLEKHREKKLVWRARDGEDSYETSVGDFTFHLDRKMGAVGPFYKVWVFAKNGKVLDNFDSTALSDIKPADEKFGTFSMLAAKIYQEVKEDLALGRVGPALSALKSV